MKKMKLQMLGLSVNDLLSREQMKKVMGGSGTGSGSGADTCMLSCTCSGNKVVNGHCHTNPCSVSGTTITCGSSSYTCSQLCAM